MGVSSSKSFTHNTGTLLLRLPGSVCRLGGQTELSFTEQKGRSA